MGLPRTDPGHFSAAFPCNTSGLYTARVRARGTTLYGSTFDREQTLTASVYPGGGNADGTGGPRDDGTSDGHPGHQYLGTDTSDPFWCHLVHCLLHDNVLSPRLLESLNERGFNLEALLRCLDDDCRKTGHQTTTHPHTALTPEALRRIAEAITTALH